MKNLYNTLKPEVKLAFDKNKKTHKNLYDSVKRELTYHKWARDLTMGTFKDFELCVGKELKQDFYLNYWK
jgi:hypothetical protein